VRPALLLALYLGDQMVSGALPFSSGPFSIAAVLLCWRSSIVTAKMLRRALIAAVILLAAGFLGARLSGTPAAAFFVATTLMVTLMWVIGAGLRPGTDLLITPRMALIGVAIATAFMVLSLLGWDAQTMILKFPTNRGAGLFTEPSHYALFVMPLWLIAYQAQQYRPILYAALVFTCVTCFSATLVAFGVIAIGISLFLAPVAPQRVASKFGRRLSTVAAVAVLAYFGTIPLNVEGVPLHTYIKDRITGVVNAGHAEGPNLSSLVVLQGVELAQLSMVESSGLGVGLGNFGLSEQIISQSDYKTLINTSTANAIDLNLRDGGLLANKLLGELGGFALLIPVGLVVYLRRIRNLPDPRSRHYHGAFAAALLCLLFVRGLPYFAGPTCLALFSMAALLHHGQSARARRGRPRSRGTHALPCESGSAKNSSPDANLETPSDHTDQQHLLGHVHEH